MAKPLVIVESPAKARTIEGFLGGEFTVLASKSFPAATRAPSTATRFAVKAGAVADSSSMSQYPALTKAMRSRSRCTMRRIDGLWTRPADRPRLTRRQSTGDTS